MNKFKFKLRLEAVRKLKHMTQKRLAYLSNLSQSHISELETEKQSPTLKTIETLADALNTHPDNLLEIDTNH